MNRGKYMVPMKIGIGTIVTGLLFGFNKPEQVLPKQIENFTFLEQRVYGDNTCYAFSYKANPETKDSTEYTFCNQNDFYTAHKKKEGLFLGTGLQRISPLYMGKDAALFRYLYEREQVFDEHRKNTREYEQRNTTDDEKQELQKKQVKP